MKCTFIIIALVALFAVSSVRASKAGAQVFQAEEVFDINDVVDASEHYEGEVDYVGDFSRYGKLTDEEILDFEEMSLDQDELFEILESLDEDELAIKGVTAEALRKGTLDMFTTLEIIDELERLSVGNSGRRKDCICHHVFVKRRGAKVRKGIQLWVGQIFGHINNTIHQAKHEDCIIQRDVTHDVCPPAITYGESCPCGKVLPTPSVPTPANPGVPTPANPGVPTPANPGVPTPANPGVPTPANPGVPTPANPGVPTPANPGVPTPANPGVPTPANPGVPTPANPGVPTPANPGVPTPANPGGPTPPSPIPGPSIFVPLTPVLPVNPGLTDGEIAAIVLGSVLATAFIVLAGLFILGGLGGGAQVFTGNGPIFLRSNVEG